jgi:phenylacetic acid degradation operon negative regulatory protein
VAHGLQQELTSEDGTYALAGGLLERRSAADRLALRKAAMALHLAELREGVWIRPDNLDRQCVHFHNAATGIPADTVRSLFSLDDWATDARRLPVAVRDELDAEAVAADDFTYRFGLSVAVVRHLQLDPLLPAELIPQAWPGQDLRSAYRRFDEMFKQRLSSAFTR